MTRRKTVLVEPSAHGVVGGFGPVHGEGVERTRHSGPEGRLEGVGFGGGVGDQHRQHGGHVGLQHGCSLGDAPDGEAVASDHHLLGDGVGGHDGLGCLGPALGGEGLGRGRDSRGHRVHGQGVADQPGGAHQHLLRGHSEGGGGLLAHLVGVGHALRPGGRVGVAAVEHHCGGSPARSSQVLLANQHRGSGHLVRGEHACRAGRRAVGGGHDGEVGFAARLDAAGHPCGGESWDVGNTHGYTPTAVSPVASSNPEIRLAHWMACPAAPFTRLSMAHSTTTVLVRAS